MSLTKQFLIVAGSVLLGAGIGAAGKALIKGGCETPVQAIAAEQPCGPASAGSIALEAGAIGISFGVIGWWWPRRKEP